MERQAIGKTFRGPAVYRGDDPGTLSEQQAAKCDLYFVRMEDEALRPIKIGKSFASGKRLRLLQCGSPYPLVCVGLIYGEGHFEAAWHKRFSEQTTHERKQNRATVYRSFTAHRRAT